MDKKRYRAEAPEPEPASEPSSKVLEFPALGATHRAPMFPKAPVLAAGEDPIAFERRCKIFEGIRHVEIVVELLEHDDVIAFRHRLAAAAAEIKTHPSDQPRPLAWISKWRQIHVDIVRAAVRAVPGVKVGNTDLALARSDDMPRLLNQARMLVDVAQRALDLNELSASDRDFLG